ncbi:MAG: hypothetical protein EOM18_13720, partial [Clostridia bacterium]|nr:hypothetical protein [Clostridia bacterium]
MIVMMKKNKENNKNSYALATGIILGLCILTIAAYGLVLFFSNRWEALHHSSSMPYYRSIVEKEEGSYALFDEDENQISDEYEELDEEDLQSGRYFVRYGKMKDGEMHRGFVNVLTGKEEWEVDG